MGSEIENAPPFEQKGGPMETGYPFTAAALRKNFLESLTPMRFPKRLSGTGVFTAAPSPSGGARQ